MDVVLILAALLLFVAMGGLDWLRSLFGSLGDSMADYVNGVQSNADDSALEFLGENGSNPIVAAGLSVLDGTQYVVNSLTGVTDDPAADSGSALAGYELNPSAVQSAVQSASSSVASVVTQAQSNPGGLLQSWGVF